MADFTCTWCVGKGEGGGGGEGWEGVDTSIFEGLIPRPSEPVGRLHSFFLQAWTNT